MELQEIEKLLQEAEAEVQDGRCDRADRIGEHILEQIKGKEHLAIEAHTLKMLGASAYYQGHLSKGIKLSEQCLKLYNALNDRLNQAKVLNNLGTLLLRRGQSEKALNYLKESCQIYQELDTPELLASTLHNLASLYHHHAKYNEAIEIYRKVIAVYLESGSPEDGIESMINIGHICLRTLDISSAYDYYFQALQTSQRYHKLREERNALVALGILQSEIGEFSESLEFLERGLRVAEKIGEKPGIAYVQSQIGIVYRSLEKYKEAETCFNIAIELYAKEGFYTSYAKTLNSLGRLFILTDRYEEATQTFEQARNIARQHSFPSAELVALHGLGEAMVSLQRYEEGLNHYTECLELTNQIDLDERVVDVLGSIGNLYAMKGWSRYNAQQAEEYLLKSIEQNKEENANAHLCNLYHALSNLYAGESRWEEALEHYTRYHELERKVLSEKAQKKALIMESSRKLAVIEKEQEITRKKNAELEERNKIIRNKNIELESLNGRLTRLNREKNEFLGIAAHDLKNPLSSITLQTTLLERELHIKETEEIATTLVNIRSRTQGMLSLITRILNINAIESEAEELECYRFDLSEAVKRVVEDSIPQARNKSIELVFIGESTPVMADRPSVMQVAENLLSNGIKYTPHSGRIEVRIWKEGKKGRLSVRDTGPGIAKEEMGRLFERYHRLSSQPTGGESATGLGLSIVKRLVENMNGMVWCESTIGKGCCFIVELPSTLSIEETTDTLAVVQQEPT